MHVTVSILDGPLPVHNPLETPHVTSQPAGPDELAPSVAHELSGAGAILVFEGVVRGREADRDIVALDYQAYEPMATNMLRQLAERICQESDLLAVDVTHSRGRVAVGECSFRLVVRSRHRKEGLRAMDWFIDQMKQDVPIWKSPVYAQGGT